MTMTDPIADMLTRIRNANKAGLDKCDIPASKMIPLTRLWELSCNAFPYKLKRDSNDVIPSAERYRSGLMNKTEFMSGLLLLN